VDERDSNTIRRKLMWRLVSTITGTLGAMVAQNLLRRTYSAIRKDEPTAAFDPTAERFSWPNALLWAMAAGIGLVVARMVGDRAAAIVWKATTGTAPPGRSNTSVA
jgi:Protein of unknown function (DUF4235)